MINDIIDSMCRAIRQKFGSGYRIYTEQMKQGIEEPCFFISLLQPENKEDLTHRRKLTHLISVQYFAGSDEPKAECNNVYESLQMLERLTVGTNCFRGELEFKSITDGVMTITVKYKAFMLNVTQEETMETMNWKGRVKNGGNDESGDKYG